MKRATFRGAMIKEEINILLVEDDEEDFFLLKRILSAARTPPRVKLHASTSLTDALNQIKHGDIDTVLLDLSLTDSQGEETFIQLHQQAPLLPVIVLTGLDDEDLAISTVQKGAQDYLVKGTFQGETLIRSIRYAIERQRLIDELEARNADLQESGHRLETIINGNTDAMLIVNHAGIVEFSNAAAARLFNCSREDLMGSVFGIPPVLTSPTELGLFDGKGNHATTEMRVVSTVWRHAHAHLILLRDISQQKRTEEALRLYRDHLKELVQRRTDQLSRINDELNNEIQEHKETERALRESVRKLRAHSQAQLDFVSNVSHELKTPLSSIGYAVNNLLTGVAGPVPPRIKAYLVMINEDIDRLSGTITDILDMSRIEARTLAIRQIKLHLSRLVLHTISSIQDMARAKNHRITFCAKHDRSFVAVDPNRIERVIINIVGNAMKFTPEGGLIEVRIFTKPSSPDTVWLTVADTGIGIGPEHIDHVTERYYRVGEHVDGTGLGLALCKEITELHGGTLTVQSPPDEFARGTQVNISFPTCPPPTLLIVDDEPLNLNLVMRQLEPHGYNVVTSNTARHALDIIESRPIDSIVADILLPAMDGIELISRIKTNRRSESIPVVVITGAHIDGQSADMLNDFDIPVLHKPWKAEELMAAIEDTAAGRHFLRGHRNGTPPDIT